MDVAEINLYPIKSLRGTSVSEAVVCSYGLEHDRNWMLIDADGKKLTQREWPGLAKLVPHLENGNLRVEVPEAADIIVARNNSTRTTEQIAVDLWGHEHVGAITSHATNRAFTEAVGRSCRLLSLSSGSALGPEDAAFHDDAPFLVISQASLDDLNRRLPSPLPMNRFRPSVVVTGSQPFEEDTWQRITIGDAEFTAVKLCVRCSMTTVDQAEGEFRGPEPLRTLATFRRVEQNVAFGAYFRPVNVGGKLSVGDELRVLETKL
jgi:uncharacterized protein YcbX